MIYKVYTKGLIWQSKSRNGAICRHSPSVRLTESVNLGIDSEIKLSVSEGRSLLSHSIFCQQSYRFYFESALIESIDDVSDDDDLLPNILDSELGEK